MLEKAAELQYIGGIISAAAKPSPFVCLLLKLLQIQPDKDIAVAYIQQDDFKYLRALGAFYLRLVGTPVDVYTYLEPLLGDYRKLRKRTISAWSIDHMDEFVDELLTQSSCLGIALPHLAQRRNLQRAGKLEPRVSPMQGELEALRAAAPAAGSGGDAAARRRERSRSPPPGARRQQKHGDIALSVEQWNSERQKLGLAPLR